jgi:cytochrome c5
VASEAIGRGFESLRAHHLGIGGGFILARGHALVRPFSWTAMRTRCGRANRWIVRNYDLEFLKKFSMVLGFLVLVTFGLMVVAYFVHLQVPYEPSPAAAQRTQARIAPVGAVYAGSTGAAAQAAATAAAAAAASSQVAYGGTLDGAVIFDSLCAGCHRSGAGGAPTMSAAQWAARIPQGRDTLNQHAIEGFTGSTGVMPAKGGNPALTDEQVIATVDWMLANLK